MSKTKASDARSSPESLADVSLARTAAWILALAVWCFTVASLLGFDPGDPPSHLHWPHNDPVRNWCGPVGAFVAYHLIKLLGIGAWVLVGGLGLFVLGGVAGRRSKMVALRSVGIVMLAGAAACAQSLLLPKLAAFPDIAGGLVGAEGGLLLSERFGVLGAALWLALGAILGAIVAFDRWLILAPLWAAKRGAPVARMATEVAGATATSAGALARSAGAGLGSRAFSWFSRLTTTRSRPRVRVDDLDDMVQDQGPKPRRKASLEPKRSRATAPPADDVPIARVAETLQEDGVDELEADPIELDEADEDQADDQDDGSRRAKAAFDEAALREKISKLPIAFAQFNRTLATDDDLRDVQNTGEMEGYRFPGLDLLENPEENFSQKLEELVKEQGAVLEAALRQYRIDGEVVAIESGPVITLYNVRLAPGTKVAQLQTVASDVARALKAVNIRIVPNQAGRDTVGVEVPNPTKERVRLKELMSKTETFARMKLPTFMGKDASGEPLIADLAQMPHMLIAGTTGSGKSVCMNTIIMGFLYTKKPSELKLVLVDPKMVEMSQFKDIPHLMCPVVTEMGKATAILEWACGKMDERYELLAEAGCRDIAAYNDLPWEELKERFQPGSPEEEARIPRKLPYMVFIIDELADLMMTNKEVESHIIRIAQKARAVGIHLILATQRPQATVVTGLIKSNMPCRVCFKVASGMDSRIVLDQRGGELLLGQGDMLYLSPRTSKLTRAQGTLVDDIEIRRVVKFMREVARPTFERQLLALRSGGPLSDEERIVESKNHASASLMAAQEDPLFDRAVEIVLETKRGSVSLLQRRLAIGYTRASRLIDLMGIAGIISDHKGSVARDVMISTEEWSALKSQAARDVAAGRGPGQGQLFPEGAPGEAPPFDPTDDAIDDQSDELEEAPASALDEEDVEQGSDGYEDEVMLDEDERDEDPEDDGPSRR